MRLVTKPGIYLIAWTQFQCPPHLASLWSTDSDRDGEQLVEFAGRNCYASWNNPAGRTNEEYCGRLLEQAHLSVLEHGTATFYIENVSRSLTHELVRHRMLSFSQLSQRYVADREGTFVVPPAIQGDPFLENLFSDSVALIHRSYQVLLSELERFAVGDGSDRRSKKAVREAARSLLPNCSETRIVATGNYRAWRHFIRKRATLDADAEIRGAAVRILQHLVHHVPALFADYTLAQEDQVTYAVCGHNES